MKKFEIHPGNEIRGMMVRLYPDKETEQKLLLLEGDARRVWNWLVKTTEDVIEARKAYAIRHGLVSPSPTRPTKAVLDSHGVQSDTCNDSLTPEQTKEVWDRYYQEMREWGALVHKATDKLPECAYRPFKDLMSHFGAKFDYQLLQKVDKWYHEDDTEKRLIEGGAHFYQALTKNYFTKGVNQRRKKFRRSSDPMPLQVRSGECFDLGDFGTRRGNTFYNCRIRFNGLKIKGRLPGRKAQDPNSRQPGSSRAAYLPHGMVRVLEGVSITRKADGWWASVKVEVPIRQLPPAIPGTVVGIDVGLFNIAAMSDGTIVSNERGKEYAERVAGRQAMASQRKEQGLPVDRMEKATRNLQLRASRHMTHVIYNQIIKPLATVEAIKIEELNAKIGQIGGSSKVSVMRRIRSLLLERYGARTDKGEPTVGNRVREVEPHYTSQDCSQCGHRSKETWSYEHGRIGECPVCKYRADRDLNAARNIASKPLISLAS